MKCVWENEIENVHVIEPSVHRDYRGDLWTYYKEGRLDFVKKDLSFNHDKFSTSRKNVVRGIHGDFKSWKLITCVYGELYFVIVDNRKKSKTYHKWNSMLLDDVNRNIVLLPPGVGNGFLVLSDKSVFSYKWSYEGNYPDVEEQFTIKWNDPTLNIYWPVVTPILQERDR